MNGSDHTSKVYEQYWLHLRHQELQRIHFTSAFALIFGVVLTFTIDGTTSTQKQAILLFLAFLSIVGLMLVQRWNFSYIHYREMANKIQEDWKIQDLNIWNREPEIAKKSIIFKVPASSVYISFYAFCFGLCVGLFMLAIEIPLIYSIILPSFIAILLILFFTKMAFEYRHEIREIIYPKLHEK
ncbi:MAG: hypothetical protein BWY93_00140 [Euryarchaeota archaeon ADurb.BinA087]|nr:MAG: hypothetical protein BWY93_00140 [Euryarchaeota archaeon ADurb.BinA087]